MKSYRCILKFSLLLLALPLGLSAQETEIQRPSASDKASGQLIQNFLTVTGGKDSHQKIQNIVAEGSITEAGFIREFTAIETADGRRKITYRWKVLGRPHENVEAFDGERSWRQNILPKEDEAKNWSGRDASYFIHQRWFIQPFLKPLASDYVFDYEGKSKVNGRPAHIVVGYGKDNERSWFYFDQEKFLLTRWGGIGLAAGQEIYLDYRARRFKSVEGIALPQELDLLIQDDAFGQIRFDRIRINQPVPDTAFTAKVKESKTLRQIKKY